MILLYAAPLSIHRSSFNSLQCLLLSSFIEWKLTRGLEQLSVSHSLDVGFLSTTTSLCAPIYNNKYSEEEFHDREKERFPTCETLSDPICGLTMEIKETLSA